MSKLSEQAVAALRQLDGSGSDTEWVAIRFLKQELGSQLPVALLDLYRQSSRAGARAACVYHAIRHSPTDEAAYQLGLEALEDKSKIVRYRACMLLSYAQRSSALIPLQLALERAKGDTSSDITAAIDAIASKNHNFFVDREHSGMMTLNIGS
jgi:hypothetical protein